MNSYIVLSLDAPLMSFGGVSIDSRGPTDRWPSVSLLTGLLGNALGVDRTERELLERLQNRMRHASVVLRAGTWLRDFQTAELDPKALGWTTLGTPEGRDGGANTYNSPHIRYREYWADALHLIAVGLTPPDEDPTLAALERALKYPARPLFIGRKPCLPSGAIYRGHAEGNSPLDALERHLAESDTSEASDRELVCFWSPEDDPRPGVRDHEVSERRDWISGVHSGSGIRREGVITIGKGS